MKLRIDKCVGVNKNKLKAIFCEIANKFIHPFQWCDRGVLTQNKYKFSFKSTEKLKSNFLSRVVSRMYSTKYETGYLAMLAQ